MLFMADPIKNFEKIRDIQNPFAYIEIAETNSKRGIFESFLKRFFFKADYKRAKILVFLIMLKPTGEIGYLLVDRIIDLFVSCPKPFLDVLRKRTDWANFVEFMKAGNWIDFIAAVRGLADSGFEGTFKRYVLKDRHGDFYSYFSPINFVNDVIFQNPYRQ